MYQRYGKRLLDLALVTLALIILTPLFIVISLWIRIRMGAPVLFRQTRPGRYGRPFTLYKFRTMNNAVDEQGRLLPDAERITPLGHFLRRSSLDELPEAINILKGEMSLVGPRPLLMDYLSRYTPDQARRHEVRPGLSGLAQVHGRNNLTWDEKFALDIQYVDHLSVWLDLGILARTAWTVLRREGISEPGQATASPFMGATTASSTERTQAPIL